MLARPLLAHPGVVVRQFVQLITVPPPRPAPAYTVTLKSAVGCGPPRQYMFSYADSSSWLKSDSLK